MNYSCPPFLDLLGSAGLEDEGQNGASPGFLEGEGGDRQGPSAAGRVVDEEDRHRPQRLGR